MHVYVIARDQAPMVKIGRSASPERRIATLEKSGGFACAEVWISPPLKNPAMVERNAHVALAGVQATGEWFDTTLDDAVQVVQQVIANSDGELSESSPSGIADRIQQRLDAIGAKAAHLAEHVGVSRGNVSLWLNGDVQHIKPTNLFACAEFLKCDMRWLITGQGSEEPIADRAADILAPLTPVQRAQALRMLEAFAASCASEGDE